MDIDISEVMRLKREEDSREFLTKTPIEDLKARLELLGVLSMVETKKIVVHTIGIIAIVAILLAVNFTEWFTHAGILTNMLLCAALVAAIFKRKKAVSEHYQISQAKYIITKAVDAREYLEKLNNQS